MLTFFILFTYVLTIVNAVSVPEVNKKKGPSILSFDLELDSIQTNTNARSIHLNDLKHLEQRYIISFFAGSNRQKTRALIDTGLRLLNLHPNSYDPKTLKTAKNTSSPFHTKYLFTSLKGWLFHDQIILENGLSVEMEFGCPDLPMRDVHSAFGIGDNKNKKQSLPWVMRNSGHIPKAQYSLYMDEATKKGKIIFGGIDVGKYSGTLIKNPADSSGIATSLKEMSTFKGTSLKVDDKLHFDTGSFNAYFEKPYFEWLAKQLGATGTGDTRLVKCNLSSKKYVTFKLTKNAFRIPYLAFITQKGKKCVLLIKPSNHNILGQRFMKYLYMSFDYEGKTIAIAPYRKSASTNLHAA